MEYHATLRELLELDAISQTTLAETLGWTVALCFMIFVTNRCCLLEMQPGPETSDLFQVPVHSCCVLC